MADDDLTLLMLERQRKAACEAAGIPYVPDVLAVREAAKCDPEIPAVEDALLDANPMPTPPVTARELPRPLVVRSPAVTVVCEVGSGTATSAYDESSIEMYLDDIPEITRAELYRIAGSRDAIQNVLDTSLEPLAAGAVTESAFDAAVMAASTVEATAAAGIRRKAIELRGSAGTGAGSTGLYAIAELTALSRLVCTFSSPEVWVICDSGEDSGFATSLVAPVPLPAESRYRYRSAGFAVSEVSALDALDLAVRDAIADPTFTCVYVSVPMTVTCADLDPVFNLTYSPPFTWEGDSYATLAALGAAGFQAYSLDSMETKNQLVYSVEAGTFSASTQEEADARALAAALDQLNCFFPSREMVVDCENRSLDNAVTQRMAEPPGRTKEEVFAEMDSDYTVLDPSLVTNYGILERVPGPGADVDTDEGLRVEVPAGMTISQSSTEDADAEARAHALGFLACFWVSPEVTCSCVDTAQVSPAPGSYWFTSARLVELKAPLRESSSTGVLTFAKGELGSSEDGFIDVSDSMNLCKASLVCIYCNETIDPRCHELEGPGGTDLWSGGDEDLPLGLTPADEGVSTGISAGLPSGVICDSDPELVNTLAISTGSLPPLLNGALGVPVCKYGNLELSKSCVQQVGSLAYALTPDSAARTISVAAGSFEATTQTAADELAAAFLAAALSCEFGNPPMTILCGASAASSPPAPVDYITEVTYGDGAGVIASGASGGVGSPLSIEAHAFTSLESPASAKAQAFLSLISQLNCFWENASVQLKCGAPPACPTLQINKPANDPEGIRVQGIGSWSPNSIGIHADWGVPLHAQAVYVEASTFISSVNQREANRQAYAEAHAQLDCFWENANVQLKCGAPPTCPTAKLTNAIPPNATIEYGANELRWSTNSIGSHAGWGPPYHANAVFVAEFTSVSYISQADANKQAYAEAHAKLDCFWENAKVELKCGAPPAFSSDASPDSWFIVSDDRVVSPGPGHEPTDSLSADIPAGEVQVGNNEPDYSDASTGVTTAITIPKRTVISYRSQYDANADAYSTAYGQLDCFWENAKVDLKCTAPQECPPIYYDYDETQEIQVGSVDVLAPKEPLAIPPLGPTTYSVDSTGYNWEEVVTDAATVVSYISQGDANRQAYRMAWALLDCFWASARVELKCIPLASPLPFMLLKGEDETIESGSVTETLVTTEAKAITSYRNQADANMQAYRLTAGQLDCDTEGGGNAPDWQYHAFSLTATPNGGGGGGCCAVRLDPAVEAANLNILRVPDAVGVYNSTATISPDGTALPGSCAPMYFYLKAYLQAPQTGAPLYARYTATAGEIEVSSTVLAEIEGPSTAYTIVRRMLAFAQGGEADCSDLQIVQLVTKPQKLVTSLLETGNEQPAIVDEDSPLPGAVSPVAFRCSYNSTTESVDAGPGKYEYPLGTFVSVAANTGLSGSYIYARIEQNSDGTLATSGFTIVGEPSELPFTQRDTTDKFVEYSNVLLAEVSGSVVTQHRVGNLSLLHRLINGAYCLWAESTGGAP